MNCFTYEYLMSILKLITLHTETIKAQRDQKRSLNGLVKQTSGHIPDWGSIKTGSLRHPQYPLN